MLVFTNIGMYITLLLIKDLHVRINISHIGMVYFAWHELKRKSYSKLQKNELFIISDNPS